MGKHLILGSSGQIGTALKNFLQSQNEEIIEFDLKRSLDEDLRYDNDLLDLKVLESDFVYFLAYDVGGAKYLDEYQNKFSFISNNMRIMTNTFTTIKRYNKPFIFASSPNYPNNSYGMLKKLGEKITFDLGGKVTRFWNVYDHEPIGIHSHVITDFIHMAKNDGVIKMRTNGFETRQFLFGEDCAKCLYTIYKNYNRIDPLQNITNFEWNSIRDVAVIISQEISGKDTIYIIPGELEDGQNYDRIEPEETNILEFWKPETSLRDGIRRIAKFV